MNDQLDDLLNEIDSVMSDKSTLPKKTNNTMINNNKTSDYTNKYSQFEENSKSNSDYSSKFESNKQYSGYNNINTKQSQYQFKETTPETKKSYLFNILDINNENRKCYSVYLSNESDSTMFGQQWCLKLRCLSCDIRVQKYEGIKWSDDCDYLFFRNYYSNPTKLKSNMIPDISKSGYSCQCSWVTVDKLVDVKDIPKLKWVCSGH